MRWAWIERRESHGSDAAFYAVGLPDRDPRSVVAALIESVHETESRGERSFARRILRERIFSTDAPTMAELELVKVAAKRMSAPVAPDPRLAGQDQGAPVFLPPLAEPRAPPDFDAEGPTRGPGALDPPAIRARLESLAREGHRASERWASDRPVSAILVSVSGHVLAEAWNTNAVLRNRHAEWNLCEALRARGERIPKGATLWVGLKPCRMCAARIWEAAEDPSALDVVYLEDDPGPLARGTMLDAGSPARQRAFGPRSSLLGIEVQRRFS